jgi:hypothetical protein
MAKELYGRPPKSTKAELHKMLAEAVRNTQPQPRPELVRDRQPEPKRKTQPVPNRNKRPAKTRPAPKHTTKNKRVRQGLL